MNQPLPDTRSHLRAARAWLWAGGGLALATALGHALDSPLALPSQALLYVLAIVVIAYALPWHVSLASALSAVVAFNFFFVPPRWTFQVESSENIVALTAMALVALAISQLSARLRAASARSDLNARRAHQLQALASGLAGATTPHEIAVLGQQHLDLAFGGPNYLRLDPLHPMQALPAMVADGLSCCAREASVMGPGTGRWPGLNAWYLPLEEGGSVVGALCVQPAHASDADGRAHAQAMAALLGQAVQRLTLQSHVRDAAIEMQRQQTQGTLLAAMAHDLRTPLAAIVGAASALQTQGEKIPAPERARLLESITQEAIFLSDVTENTLQWMQLAQAPGSVRRGWESMEEIVGSVLARMRQRDPLRRIRSQVPRDLPLIQADPVLLAQLLTNLLDNALKYSTDAITLEVSATPDTLTVAVKDRGPGIAPHQVESIFAPYVRGAPASTRGSGLGLAVCRTIAEIHGASLTVHRRTAGGSCFALRLPLSAPPPPREIP